MEYFGTNLSEHGHYMFNLDGEYMVKTWRDFKHLPFNPEEMTNNLPKGEVIYYQGGGYTVIGISGSCKDTRPGTKSIFFVKELLTKDEMIDRVNQNKVAKTIINALPFDVRW